MRPPLLSLLVGACFASLAAAADPTPAPPAAPAPVPPPSPVSKDIKLQNRSTFNPDLASKRSPFLPMGYKKAVVEGPKEVVLNVTAEMFTVSAILLGSPPLSIINGRDRGIGDRIGLNPAGTEFVTVKRIEDGQVILLYKGRDIVVPSGRRK